MEDDISVSRKNLLRGFHGDEGTWKLIQCLKGAFYLVALDMRRNSKTYLNWHAITLDERSRTQALVPAGCANAHLCLTNECMFSYKQSTIYGTYKQFTVLWDDPRINVFWPISDPILSERDKNCPPLT